MIVRQSLVLLLFVLFAVSNSLAAEAEAVVKVDKMSCGSCLNRINTTVSELDGTQGISKYDFPKGHLWFTYQSDRLTAQKIAETITEAGYPATVIDDGLKAQ